MYKMKKLTLLLCGSVFLLSCNSPSETTPDQEHDHETHEVSMEEHSTDHHHTASDEEIELNDGERWVVNEEMKPYVAETEKLLGDFNPETDDHVQLSENLTEQNNALIASCTMTGKSHEELHKWLHPHMEYVKQMGEATNEDEIQKSYEDLKHSIQTYHEYFQ